MKKEDKQKLIEDLTQQIDATDILYITDISHLNMEKTTELRRLCFRRNVQLRVVKNTLLRKAMERSSKNYEGLYPALKGDTSIMISDTPKTPAVLIRDFRKQLNSEKPVLKGAYIDEATYLGNDQLQALISIKNKFELIGDVIGLLQSPARNVLGALQSGGHTLSGLVKTLSERSE